MASFLLNIITGLRNSNFTTVSKGVVLVDWLLLVLSFITGFLFGGELAVAWFIYEVKKTTMDRVKG